MNAASVPGAGGHDPLAALWQPRTIRARCAAIAAAVEDGRSEWFTVQRAALPDLAECVARLTRDRFPDLVVPPHSRWRHFAAGGLDRAAELDERLAHLPADDALRARIDLTVVSVLLDAGAGPDWHYDEALTEGDPTLPRRHARSEGLAVASFRGFMDGLFSQHADDPFRVDAGALTRLDVGLLRQLFQVGPTNPMTGLEGRTALLRSLGALLESQARTDGGPARPSRLLEPWLRGGEGGGAVDAGALLARLVRDWAPIWLHGSRVLGQPAGDVWPHRWAGGATGGSDGQDRSTSGWVPFHKLSQWLTYSLLEPLQASGRVVQAVEALTGLPEYRNGGLLLDGGALLAREPADLARSWAVGDAFVVEWRALTVHLLDELARQVRERLGVDARRLPLASVLEGGTWAAGRQLAQERRGGTPPVQVRSDGTVF